MPEGPSLVILKEKALIFKGKKVIGASGYADLDLAILEGKKVTDVKTWGKQLLICFKGLTVRIHLMLFGSYLIDDRKKVNAKLSLQFANGEINFYTCSVKFIESPLAEVYDWEVDIMSDEWNPKKAFAALRENESMLVCDALMDQQIFSGSGNIIKNEVLFNTRIHPLSVIKAIPDKKLREVIKETSRHSFDFLDWKKEGTLTKHFRAYEKKICPRCDIPFKLQITGKSKRKSYFCSNCQELYKVGKSK